MTDLLFFIFLLHLFLLLPFFIKPSLRFFSLKTMAAFLLISFALFAFSKSGSAPAELCEVAHGSPLWNAGLREGATILEVNGEKVASAKQAEGALLKPAGNSAQLKFTDGKELSVALPKSTTPWWWPRIAGEDQDRFQGISFRCRPPVLRVLPEESLLLQISEFSSGARIASIAGKRVVTRRDLEAPLLTLGPKDVIGLHFYSQTRSQNLLVMKQWISHKEEGSLYQLGSPESGLAIFRVRNMSGLGDPDLPSYHPLREVDGERVFSPFGLLQRHGTIKKILVGKHLQIFADFTGVGIVFLPHFVEGPALTGSVLFEPFRFLWRLSFARGFSFVDLVRERHALPWSWYQIDSVAFQRTAYWIFRLACAALLLAMMAGFGWMLAAEKKVVLPENKKALVGIAFLGTLLMAKDLFLIWLQ